MQDSTPPVENEIDNQFIEKVSSVLQKQKDKILRRRMKDESYRFIANGLCTLSSGTVYATYPTGWKRLTKKTNQYGTR